jgi:hypothetical protein
VASSTAEPRAGMVRSTAVLSSLRRLAAVTSAGAVAGLVVGGIGSRLAMMLLARLNPAATGVQSDDGFTIGQFSSATLDLLVVTTILGVLGGGIYFLLRGLMIGPRWFQVLSVSVGPAVVVGAMIVHTDGVDFTLEPVLLGVGLFVLVPGLYAAALTVLAERWLGTGGWFETASPWLAFLPFLLWVPLAPVLGVLLVVVTVGELLRRSPGALAVLRAPAWAWAGRAALTGVFLVALKDLAGDIATLT